MAACFIQSVTHKSTVRTGIFPDKSRLGLTRHLKHPKDLQRDVLSRQFLIAISQAVSLFAELQIPLVPRIKNVYEDCNFIYRYDI